MCDSTRGRVMKRPLRLRLRRCSSDESATWTEVKGRANHAPGAAGSYRVCSEEEEEELGLQEAPDATDRRAARREGPPPPRRAWLPAL